ncbi:SRPBCC domain-containing protein [Staphylococcus cohnii]|uniref:SRPBCC domain-containing protein n=1 Tax=Staphylococcus cohnii TaxID=29382 RepID=UPI000D1BEA98|nr:SRPBCC domain-containing protein [Staphylococcus cohnii]PTE79599.1 hypothetical protein BUY38_04950 [Staphylococcus cohnii]PTF17902.1 hypothetical protein BUY40_11505 [Staphylococcus cohnii]PTF25735.1 hypothetical protein BUY30_01660 [Staphylococcus cohnii]PTF30048.1 hypothetical protein BUY31_01085 [Staphylococcus cohnii]PTF33852.1 hypothetical protein BUY21_02585 [Staphylococcus cohnii]
MAIQYAKDQSGIYQTINLKIKSDAHSIFDYLSTTEGIQQWFPQLSFQERVEGGKMLFHLDDSEDLEMRITHFEANKRIGFTWDIGKVKFELYEHQSYVELIFYEYLPFEFPHITLDFAGWQFQIESIKNIAETGKPLEQQDCDFEAKKTEIEASLAVI